MKSTSYVLLASLFILSSPVWADPCDKDRHTTCNDTTSGEGQVYDCLVGRQDRVAPECSKAIDRSKVLVDEVIRLCQPEVQRWCAQYTGGKRSDVIDCLKSNKDKVAEPCRRAYRQFKSFGFDIKS